MRRGLFLQNKKTGLERKKTGRASPSPDVGTVYILKKRTAFEIDFFFFFPFEAHLRSFGVMLRSYSEYPGNTGISVGSRVISDTRDY